MPSPVVSPQGIARGLDLRDAAALGVAAAADKLGRLHSGRVESAGVERLLAQVEERSRRRRRWASDGGDRFDLVVIGDLNPDAIVAGDAMEPEFGQAERLADAGTLALGGSGGIVSSGAARLGLRVAHVGVVGDDAAGRFVLDELRERGVDVAWCRVDPTRPTGITVALSRGDDRAMLTSPGAIAALRPEDVPAAALGQARHVHMSSFFLQEGLRDGAAELLASARAGGATTSLDSGWDPRDEWAGGLDAALSATDVFLPNGAEACRIAGADDPEDALDRLCGARAHGRGQAG